MTIFANMRPLASAARFLLPRRSGLTRRDHRAVHAIRERADALRNVRDERLVDRTRELQHAVQAGADPVSAKVLLTGSALVCEASRRALGISLYDVQLLAGLALSQGKIAEMQTGEGKTFVAALPAFVHALRGKGVHVLTVNDYLAQRDYELMQPVFHLLGLSAGFLKPSDPPESKRRSYACDVTYGAGYEFGFDYLRDQASLLARRKPRLGQQYRDRLSGRCSSPAGGVQRDFAFCVVDEIDSVLIDEATTPLLLSGSGLQQAANDKAYLVAQEAIATLIDRQDFMIDDASKQVCLTPQGVRAVAEFGHRAARHILVRPWTVYVRQSLHAEFLLKRDVDYIVDDEKVLLVDKNTGRILPDRSWRDGLQQAVEAKEGVPITPEQQPLAQITRQRFFRLYDDMCGMTGTASGNEGELKHFYRLPVVIIPTRKPQKRRHLQTRYFADQASKFAAILAEIKRVHATRQPILVGTRTIEVSEILAAGLRAQRTPFRLLNGKQDEKEAHIVGCSGEAESVTVATNMAGRGTDIKLGRGVSQLGGLHVIGTERHESARVDRQLVGRAARQGEPGSSQFFVSAEDSLIKLYAPSLGQRMKRLAADAGELKADCSREVANVQATVERSSFAQRQQMFAHDRWLERVLSSLAEER